MGGQFGSGANRGASLAGLVRIEKTWEEEGSEGMMGGEATRQVMMRMEKDAALHMNAHPLPLPVGFSDPSDPENPYPKLEKPIPMSVGMGFGRVGCG